MVQLTDLWLKFGARVEILSLSNLTGVWQDITEFVNLSDSYVYRRSGQNVGVHAVLRLTVRDNTIIEPDTLARVFVLVEDVFGDVDTYDYGVYVLSKPSQIIDVGGTNPVTWTGDDLTTLLDNPAGYTIIAEATTHTNAIIGGLITDAVGVNINRDLVRFTFADVPINEFVPPGDWAWALTNKHTWRFVINEVLLRSGARRLWMRQDGVFASNAETQPSVRPVSLTLDAHNIRSIVGSKLTVSADIKNWPNRWIFIRDDISQEASEIDTGDHIIIVTNIDTGPAALNAIGQSRTSLKRVESTSIESFIRQAHAIAEEELYPVETVTLNIVPVPTLWHQDIIVTNVPDANWNNVRGILLELNYRLDGQQDMMIKIERLT